MYIQYTSRQILLVGQQHLPYLHIALKPLYGIHIQLGFQHWSLSNKTFSFFYSFRAKLAHPYCYEEKMLTFLRLPS